MDASLICFVLGLAALASCVITHRRGQLLIGLYGRRISRVRDPVEFWIAQGFLGAIAVGLLLVPILLWSGLLGMFVDQR
jgi:hypothetical protein